MTRTTVDAETRAKLNGLNDYFEFCDESGRTLGYFFPPGTLKALSPHCDEEIERRRQKRTGRPLREILRELEGRGWNTYSLDAPCRTMIGGGLG